jgi:hypothetical protein
MERRVYEFRGRAKTWAAIGVFAFMAWSFFGRSLFDFNFGFFNRGYQTSFLRGGHFERRGIHWSQHDLTLGRIVSLGGENAAVDVNAEIHRGTAVIHVWRWPPFLYGEPTVHRTRLRQSTRQRLNIPLDSAGVYVLSVTGLYFGGDLTVDWDTGGIEAIGP